MEQPPVRGRGQDLVSLLGRGTSATSAWKPVGVSNRFMQVEISGVTFDLMVCHALETSGSRLTLTNGGVLVLPEPYLGVKWWKQRVGVRMLRVELGHPRAALGRPPKLFGDGACGRAGVW